MSNTVTCSGSVWDRNSYRGYPCSKPGKYEYNGKMYCKSHHPPSREEKNKAFNERISAEIDLKRQERLKAEADKAELERRASEYDSLSKRIAELEAERDRLDKRVYEAESVANYWYDYAFQLKNELYTVRAESREGKTDV